jgi:hypothetical protein
MPSQKKKESVISREAGEDGIREALREANKNKTSKLTMRFVSYEGTSGFSEQEKFRIFKTPKGYKVESHGYGYRDDPDVRNYKTQKEAVEDISERWDWYHDDVDRDPENIRVSVYAKEWKPSPRKKNIKYKKIHVTKTHPKTGKKYSQETYVTKSNYNRYSPKKLQQIEKSRDLWYKQLWAKRKVKKPRKFGNKLYEKGQVFTSKKDALSRQKTFKSYGWDVRIVKSKKGWGLYTNTERRIKKDHQKEFLNDYKKQFNLKSIDRSSGRYKKFFNDYKTQYGAGFSDERWIKVQRDYKKKHNTKTVQHDSKKFKDFSKAWKIKRELVVGRRDIGWMKELKR